MIKTNYIGWQLDKISLTEDKIWIAIYKKGLKITEVGRGSTPESAVAEAQKAIRKVIIDA